MPRKTLMTWAPSSRRWRKMHRGVWYSVSCRQLGVAETKEASWRAANAWWQAKLAEVLAGGEDPAKARRREVEDLVRRFRRLDTEARRLAYDALWGEGAFARERAEADRAADAVLAARPDRSLAAQFDAWKA